MQTVCTLTAWILKINSVSDYRAVNACKKDAGVGVSDSLWLICLICTYMPPSRNIPIISIFCFNGIFILYNKVIGRIRMTKSLRTFKAGMVVDLRFFRG